jgi:drug/metabolite transporter (DMT)-like permease
MAHQKRPTAGYTMALAAAALFAVNGTVAKTVLGGGLDATGLTALRTLGAFLGLAAFLAVTRPGTLRLTWREVPFLAVYGVVGVAFTQWLYFVAIGRLPIGVALLLEFTAPVLIAVFARFVLHERVDNRVWWALTLAVAGLALVARVWQGGTLDGIGVAAGLLAAVALSAYYLLGERGVATRDPVSLTCWSMAAAALFWSVVNPPWSFPAETFTGRLEVGGPFPDVFAPGWLLVLWVVVGGTIIPFSLSMGALRHLPATTVGVIAMAEPVLAGAVAWVWLGESLAAVQLVGSTAVIVGIALAQTARSNSPMTEVDVPVHAPAAVRDQPS